MGYDKFEARVRMAYANGTEQNYSYIPTNRRLSDLVGATASGKKGARTFMDMAYGYDAVGNVLSLANTAPIPSSPSVKGGQSRFEFGYDDLYQLTEADGEYRYPKNKTERFELRMGYDAIHNIVSKDQLAGREKRGGNATPIDQNADIGATGVQVDKKITYDWDYAYESDRPHAATQIGDRSFLYDLNGNP